MVHYWNIPGIAFGLDQPGNDVPGMDADGDQGTKDVPLELLQLTPNHRR